LITKKALPDGGRGEKKVQSFLIKCRKKRKRPIMFKKCASSNKRGTQGEGRRPTRLKNLWGKEGGEEKRSVSTPLAPEKRGKRADDGSIKGDM